MNELINIRAEAARLAADLAPKLEGLSEDEALKASIAALGEAGLLAWTVPAALRNQDGRSPRDRRPFSAMPTRIHLRRSFRENPPRTWISS